MWLEVGTVTTYKWLEVGTDQVLSGQLEVGTAPSFKWLKVGTITTFKWLEVGTVRIFQR